MYIYIYIYICIYIYIYIHITDYTCVLLVYTRFISYLRALRALRARPGTQASPYSKVRHYCAGGQGGARGGPTPPPRGWIFAFIRQDAAARSKKIGR